MARTAMHLHDQQNATWYAHFPRRQAHAGEDFQQNTHVHGLAANAANEAAK